MLIDTHQHYWHYNAGDFGWIEESMASARRDFLPQDVSGLMGSSGVGGALAVQAGQSLDETRWLISLARANPFIVGVVGWLPLQAVDQASISLAQDPLVVGARHILQAEPDEFFDEPRFLRGVSWLAKDNLTFDLLISSRQLQLATGLVRQNPGVRFVLDHLAKPLAAGTDKDAWRRNLRELSACGNVYCKLSGGIVEAMPHWTLEALAPFFDHALECFGEDRLVFGSNWPLIHAAGGYDNWMQAIGAWTSSRCGRRPAAMFEQATLRAYPRLRRGV